MMKIFRLILIVLFIGVLTYTLAAGLNHGWDLFTIFSDDLKSMDWNGQFNFDFTTYLLLSGLWIAWRHQFSLQGIFLGLIASVVGMLFFAPYLLIASFKADGNMKEILMGKTRAGN